MRDIRFGLIGYGSWGQCHAQAIQQTRAARCEQFARNRAGAVRRLLRRLARKCAHPGTNSLPLKTLMS